MVNKERVTLLVTALRSGDYEQGQGMLHHVPDNTWCCLGVACDIARKNGLEIETAIFSGSERFGNTGSDLPPKVRDWYGFTTSNPDLKLAGGQFATAVRLNDSPRYHGEESTFAGIADAFERTYLQPEEAEQPEKG